MKKFFFILSLFIFFSQSSMAVEPVCSEVISRINNLCNPGGFRPCASGSTCLRADAGYLNDDFKIEDGSVCQENGDCRSNLCIESAPSPGQARTKTCYAPISWKKLYFPDRITCKESGVDAASPDECCSGRVDGTNKCVTAYVCVKTINDTTSERCGAALCGEMDIDLSPEKGGGSETVQLVNIGNRCEVPSVLQDPNEAVVTTPDSVAKDLVGNACKIDISDEDRRVFLDADSYMKGMEFITSTSDNKDRFGFLREGQKIGKDLRRCRMLANKVYLDTIEQIRLRMSEILANSQEDPLGVKAIRYNAMAVRAKAYADLTLATSCYSGGKDDGAIDPNRIVTPDNLKNLDARGVAAIDQGSQGVSPYAPWQPLKLDFGLARGAPQGSSAKVTPDILQDGISLQKRSKALSRSISGHNWGCWKIIKLHPFIFSPCECGRFFERDKYCSSNADRFDGKSMVDNFRPAYPSNTGFINTSAKMVSAFSRYAAANDIDHYDGDYADKTDYNPFGGGADGSERRLPTIEEIARQAGHFHYLYGAGRDHQLPGRTKAHAWSLVSTYATDLIDYHSKVGAARLEQANCLDQVATNRELANLERGSTIVENGRGDGLAGAQVFSEGDLTSSTGTRNESRAEFNNTLAGSANFSNAVIGSTAAATPSGSNGAGGQADLAAGSLNGAGLSAKGLKAFNSIKTDRQKEQTAFKKAFGDKALKSALDFSGAVRTSGLNAGRSTSSSSSKLTPEGAPQAKKKDKDQEDSKNALDKNKVLSSTRQATSRISNQLQFTGNLNGGSSGNISSSNDGAEDSTPNLQAAGLSQKEVNQILSSSNERKYKNQESDSLFDKVTKAYIRNAYPAFFKKKASEQ